MRTLLFGTLVVFALGLITIIFSTANVNIDEPDDEGVNMTLWDSYADTHGVDH